MGPLNSVHVFPFVLKTAKVQPGSTHRPGHCAKVVVDGAGVDDAVNRFRRGKVARPLVVCTAEVTVGLNATKPDPGGGGPKSRQVPTPSGL